LSVISQISLDLVPTRMDTELSANTLRTHEGSLDGPTGIVEVVSGLRSLDFHVRTTPSSPPLMTIFPTACNAHTLPCASHFPTPFHSTPLGAHFNLSSWCR
jgi:hypothetical protein